MPQKCKRFLEDNKILVDEIPANCTDQLQPLDLSANKLIKSYMKHQFQLWYADEVKGSAKVIDLKLSKPKPLGLQWLVEACHYVEKKH